MREILFRGKDEGTKKWVQGYYLEGATRHCIVYSLANYPRYDVIPETVGQYTGLTDKNGTKIFENGYMIIDNKTYKVIFDNAEYILTNIFNCDIITLKNNSIKGVFVDEI